MAQIKIRGRILFNTLKQSCLLTTSSSFVFHHNLKPARCYSAKVNAKHLADLRKKTGYGLSFCREALVENDQNIDAAKKWLDEQATKRGLQKAEKLQQRKAGEGLIGVLVENNHAAMVEVCCETDFVSQNDFFHQLVAKATATALNHRKIIVQKGLDLGGNFTHFREVLLTHKLNEMRIPNSSETLNDAILQLIGRLGERITLRRAVTMTTEENSVIGCYTHGPFTFDIDGCLMGKYAALAALQPTDGCSYEQLLLLATKLTQHIVGMNPKFLSLDDGKDSQDIDKNEILLEQQYLMDDRLTVQELLHKNNALVVDFLRLECGED